MDSHLKPYRCKVPSCTGAQFSSTACRLRHEREAHGLHGHGNKPFPCTWDGCDRAIEGNGFPRLWNLRDHMRRVHNDKGLDAILPASPPAPATRGRKRKTVPSEQAVSSRKLTQRATPAKAPQDPTKPLLHQWQEHHKALRSLLDAMGNPRDPKMVKSIAELQRRSAELAKINMELMALTKPKSAGSAK